MMPTGLSELFPAFAAVSWRASWLIVALLGLRHLVRGRIPAQVWFFVWILLGARLLVPASVPAAWSPYNFAAVPVLAESRPAVIPRAPRGEIAPTRAAESAAAAQSAPMPGPVLVSGPTRATALPPSLALADWLALAWLTGAGVILAVQVAGVIAFRRRLRSARVLENRRLRRVIEQEAVRGRLGPLPALETGEVDAPALHGIFRPRLLFPPGLIEQLSDDELRHVVRHELTHGRRRDLAALTLLRLAAAVHWFNPLVWLATRMARNDCELACDECVLQGEAADSPRSYGATLLKVLGMVRGRRRPPAVVAILETRQQLAQRVQMIARYRTATMASVALGIAVVLGVFAVGVTREAAAEETRGPAAGGSRVVGGEAARSRENLASLRSTMLEQRELTTRLARELDEFRRQNEIGSYDRESDIVTATLKSATAHEVQARQELTAAENRLSQIKDYQARGADLASLPFIADDPIVADMRAQLTRAHLDLSLYAERYLERHPKMLDMSVRIGRLESALQEASAAACRRVEAGVDGARRAYASARELLEQRTHESQRFDRLKAEYDLRARELHAQEALLQEMIRRAADEMAGVAPAAATTPVPAGGFSVSVLGAVNRQGSVAFAATEKPIVLDAIARAGGFAANASRRGVRLIRVDAAGVRSTRELTEENLMAGDGDAGALRPGDVIFVPEKIR